MSFWKKNSCVPTWNDSVEAWWKGYPPRLLQTGVVVRRCPQVQNVSIREVKSKDTEDIQSLCQLWARGYSQSRRVRCVVPARLVQDAIQAGKWTVWVAVHEDGRILGTLVRRHLTDMQMDTTVWKRAAIIDYFYVVPGWKQKGVGRLLLTAAHTSAEIPMCPQLILWEGIQAGIPPLATGMYWSRERQPGAAGLCEKLTEATMAWSLCQAFVRTQGVKIVSRALDSAVETSVWKVGEDYVAVWDTHHRSVPEDKAIGVIVGCTSFDIAETFAANCSGHPWQICLSSWRMTDQWSIDSPFQWIAYNCQTGFLDTRFPCLAL